MKKGICKKSVLVLSFCLITGAMESCSFVPEFMRPDVPLEPEWVGVALEEQGSEQSPVYELGWRDYFHDAQLQQFIDEALQNNHDLKSAALAAELAQAKYRITRSEQMPVVGTNAGAARARTARDLSPTGKGITSDSYNIGLGVAAFELDFFGRVKNLSEAALNDYFGTLEARDTAQLSIISATAKSYYAMRIAEQLMNLASEVRTTREETLRLTKLQVEAGVAAGTTLQGMISAIELAKADYQLRKREWMQARNALGTLVGRPLSSLQLSGMASLDQQFPEAKLFAGVPSEILLHRPDIREAEYGLKAANANIGAARAAYFPSISLTGNLGFASTDLENLFEGNNRTWSFGPNLALPIFDYGRRKANVEMMEIGKKIAVEKYASAIQSAFADIDNALVARETLAAQFAAVVKSNAAIAERLRLTNIQLHEGIVDGLQLLDAERESFGSQQSTLAMQQLILNNRVDLYIALGGGLVERTGEKQQN